MSIPSNLRGLPAAEYEPRLPTYRDVLRAYDRAWAAWEANPDPRTFAVVQTGIAILYRELGKPGQFALGQVVMTPGASEALLSAHHVLPEFLLSHKHGDWGDLCAEDARENERSLRLGHRLLSSYQTRTEEKLWLITEWDRSATTLLLLEEY
jgi:hypothetical protein